MAVTLVQKSASTGSWAGTNTATPGALPAGATANNLLVAPYGHQQYDHDTQAITATGFSAGNSVISNVAALAGCLFKVAAGGETNATFTNTTTGSAGNSYGDVVIAEFSGLDTTSPYVSADSGSATVVGGTTLSVSSGNPLSENAGLAIVSFTSEQSLSGGTWPPSGWTSLVNDLGGNQCGSAYLIFSSNAQLTAGIGTVTASGNIAATITIFKAATSSATGTAAVTEGHDAAAGTGAASTSGSAAVTEGHDTAAGTGAASTSGSAAATEGHDTASATGSTSTSGSAAATEGHDTAAGTGSTSTSGSAAVTEGHDIASASGTAGAVGTAAITEGADSVSATGSALAPATGSAALTEGPDSAVATGTVTNPNGGVIAPPGDLGGIALQAQIATVQALVNTTSAARLVYPAYVQQLNQLQVELVDHFMVTGWLHAGTNILAVYAAPAWDTIGQALTARVAFLQNLVNTAPAPLPGDAEGYGGSGWTTVLANYAQQLYAAQVSLVERIMDVPGGTSAAIMLANLTGRDPAATGVVTPLSIRTVSVPVQSVDGSPYSLDMTQFVKGSYTSLGLMFPGGSGLPIGWAFDGALLTYVPGTAGSSAARLVATRPTLNVESNVFAISSVGASSATGSAAITEGIDSVSASGVAVSGALGIAGITEGHDTASATGAASTSGLAAVTEGHDTASATGTIGASGTAGVTEGHDTASATGSTKTTGSAAATEGHDTASATGSTKTTGSAAATEGHDTVSAAGTAGTSSVKFNPGHYAQGDRYMSTSPSSDGTFDDIDRMAAVVDGSGNPQFMGYCIQFGWNAIEPTTQGTYSSAMVTAINAVRTRLQTNYSYNGSVHPFRLIIKVRDEQTGGATACPAYIVTGISGHGSDEVTINSGSANSAAYFRAPVMSAYINMLNHLGGLYDSDPYVEGLVALEEITGFDGPPADFTESGAWAQIQNLVNGLSSWPTTWKTAYPNWGFSTESNFNANFTMFDTAGWFVGGPDLLVPATQESYGELSFYGGTGSSGTDYRGRVGCCIGIESDVYLWTSQTSAGDESYGHSTLHPTHMIWGVFPQAIYSPMGVGNSSQWWETGTVPALQAVSFRLAASALTRPTDL